MADKPRTLHPKLKIFDSTIPDKAIGSFTALPTFFFDVLMQKGPGIPASFWKFTFALMRQILGDMEKVDGVLVHTYTWKSTYEDIEEKFGLGDRATQDWTNAYQVSGLFDIVKGKRKFPKDKKGQPTIWRYRTAVTQADWLAFILALQDVLNPPRSASGRILRPARHGIENGVNSAHTFKLALAVIVDEKRAKVNGTLGTPLPPVNDKAIEFFLSRGVGKREADGQVTWEYYKAQENFVRGDEDF